MCVDVLCSDANAVARLRHLVLRPEKRTRTGTGEGTSCRSWENLEDCQAAALWSVDIAEREVRLMQRSDVFPQSMAILHGAAGLLQWRLWLLQLLRYSSVSFQVPCEVIAVDSSLGHGTMELRADLRYLRMLLEDPNTLAAEISALISARKARLVVQKDSELPYHPLVVHLFQARIGRSKRACGCQTCNSMRL